MIFPRIEVKDVVIAVIFLAAISIAAWEFAGWLWSLADEYITIQIHF